MMRFNVFDRWGNQVGVVDGVIAAIHNDELNGDDSLTLTLNNCALSKGQRIVWQDKFGEWHEHIVNDINDTHVNDLLESVVICESALNETYGDYLDDVRPYNTTATVALQRALAPTRWSVGSVTVTGNASTNFYHISAREAIPKIIEAWGGEFSTTIQISGTKVSSRSVNILTRRGADNGKRFEWTKDIQSISRRVYPDDVCTALYGYGKGLEAYDDDGNLTGGFERKLTFGDINGGLDYVADESARLVWGRPDANGNKVHVFGRAEFPECEDAAELLALTTAELQVRKQPQVAYTASVLDLADLGYDFEDVRVGDTVAIIDRDFNERLQGRVLSVRRNLFNEASTIITLGTITRNITNVISNMQATLSVISGHASAWDGAASLSTSYIDGVINSLNHDLNLTGGYTYIRQGEGIIVYDRAEDDNPTMAIRLTGAGFRIANSKDGQGNWVWRTFGTGAGFTANELIAGTIRGGNSYWNLETGDMVLANSITIGSQTVAQLEGNVSDAAKTATNYLQADANGVKVFGNSGALSAGTYQLLTSNAQKFYVGNVQVSAQYADTYSMLEKLFFACARGTNQDNTENDAAVIKLAPSDARHAKAVEIQLKVDKIGETDEAQEINFFADKLQVYENDPTQNTASRIGVLTAHPENVDYSPIYTVGSTATIWWGCCNGMVIIGFNANGVSNAVKTTVLSIQNAVPPDYWPKGEVSGVLYTKQPGGGVAWINETGLLQWVGSSASDSCFGEIVYPVGDIDVSS